MPAKVRIKILQARNLPIMSKTHESTDAFVEVKIGQDAYKTDVCWRSLDPEWVNDWFRFELSDQAFFEEPVQIRVMDHDTYTSHDAIGKVQMRLSQFLNVRVSEIKDYPYNIPVRRIYGLVDCAVLTDDPEYQWMDRIRASRTTNETRQLLFSKMSGALRRRIALKARRAGVNAIIGYHESLDVCCDSGVVMRAVGTAVRIDLPSRPAQQADLNRESKAKTDAAAPSVASSTPLTGQPQSYSFFVDDEAFISAADGKTAASNNLGKSNVGDDDIEVGAPWLSNSFEFPFMTTTSLPDKLVVRVGGLVSTRIVKKLSELEDINTHGVDYRLLPDSWLNDVRQEIRHHMLAADCNAVYGYQEVVYPVPDEDIVIISAKATAVELICDLVSVSSQGRTSADLLFHATPSAAYSANFSINNPYGGQSAANHYESGHMPNIMQSGAKQSASRKTELSAEEGTLLPPNPHLAASSSMTTTASARVKSSGTSGPNDANSSANLATCQYAAAHKRHDLFMRVVYDSNTGSTSTVDEPRVIVPSVVVSNAEPLPCIDFVGRGSLIQVRVVKSFRKGVNDRIGAGAGAGTLATPNTTGHHFHHHGAAGALAGAVGLAGAVSNAKRTYRAWHARRRGFGVATGGSEHSSSVAIGAAGHSPGTAVLTRERRSEMDVATTSISDKRRLTELLSFIEFELYSQLIGKLKVLGLNSVWKLNETLWIGKHRVVAIASGTAAYVLGLPGRPALPLVSSMSEGIDHAPDIEQQLMQFRQHTWKVLGIRQATTVAAAPAAVDKSAANRQRSTSECENGIPAEIPRHVNAAKQQNSPITAAGVVNRKLKSRPVGGVGGNTRMNNAATNDYNTGDYYFDDMEQASINSAGVGGEFIVPLLPKGGAYHHRFDPGRLNRAASPILRIELDSLNDTRRLVDLLDRFASPSIVLTSSETMPHQHHALLRHSTRNAGAETNAEMSTPSTSVAAGNVSTVGRPLRSGKLSAASAIGLNTLCTTMSTSGAGLTMNETYQAGIAAGKQAAASANWLLPGEAFVRIVLCRAASLDETLSDLMRYFHVMAGPPFLCRNAKQQPAVLHQQQQHKRGGSVGAFLPAGVNRRSSGHNVIDEVAGESSTMAEAGNTTATYPTVPPPSTSAAVSPMRQTIKVLGLELVLDAIEEADDDDLMLLTIQGTIFSPPRALDQLLSALRLQAHHHHQNQQHISGGSGSSHQPHLHHQQQSALTAAASVGANVNVNVIGGGTSISRRTGGRTSMQAAARSQSRELNALFLHRHTTNAASSVVPLHPSQLLKSSNDAGIIMPPPPPIPGNNTTVPVSAAAAGSGTRAIITGLAMLHQQSLSAASSATNSPLRFLSQPAGVPVAGGTGQNAGIVASLSPFAAGIGGGNVGVQRFARASLEQHVLADYNNLHATASAAKQSSGGASGSPSVGFRAFDDGEPPIYMSTLSYVPAPTKIVAYIGLINYYVIREEISLRESGSLVMEKTSQFLHGSLLQFAAMLRTLARAMGGNALLSLSVRQVQLMGRSQVLCHLAGDVVQIE